MFQIAPANLVKGENAWPEYKNILPALEEAAKNRASQIWQGFQFGGVMPGPRQFGISNILPRDIHGGGTATFSKSYGSAGSWCNIWSYTVPEDEVHAIAGVAIPDPTLIFSSLQFIVEDKTLPIVNIEEAHMFGGGFYVLLKQDSGKELIIPEEQSIKLMGFQERGTRSRSQRVVPVGFALYKNKDLLIKQKETGN